MTLETVQAIVRSEMLNKISLFSLQTTDATPVLIFSIDTIGAETGIIEFTVQGLSNDGLSSINIKKFFPYKNDGSTLTIGVEIDPVNNSDFTTADVSASVNANAIEVNVTGEAATVINWIGNYTQQKLNVEVALP
jgi:hypothetical protein